MVYLISKYTYTWETSADTVKTVFTKSVQWQRAPEEAQIFGIASKEAMEPFLSVFLLVL